VFSSRLPPRLAANAFSAAVADLRRQHVPLVDLTVTNPTAVGLAYPAGLFSALSDPAGLVYEPSPFGLKAARSAVWHEPDRVVLTASTSEAYSILFKLLCDPGDRVMTPEPSYPLFDLLTRLDGVQATPYRLEHHGVWSIDRESVLRAWRPEVRALLVVSPNNPTGSMLRRDDREWLVQWARDQGVALISDEVFADYPVDPRPDASSLRGDDRVLTFTLGGMSKSAGLPQVKLGWIVVSGPEDDVAAALQRLELICDTYLSVSTPVQVAAQSLLAGGAVVRDTIRQRLMQNYQALVTAASAQPSVKVLPPEGGWSVVVQVPSTIGEDALVMRLLQESHIIVHPGYFFDMDEGSHLIISLLPEPAVFAAAVRRVLEVAA
jgi:alanine-synthesizing transaminase